MNVKIVFDARKTDKDDIRAFVQMVREWELRTPEASVAYVGFESNPEITSAEAKAIFEGLFPEFEHLVETPGGQAQLLRLGSRGIAVGGKLMGTCDELTLSIGEASEEEMKQLQEAETINLVRVRKG